MITTILESRLNNSYMSTLKPFDLLPLRCVLALAEVRTVAVVLLTVKNPFISRDIILLLFAHALPRLRLRIHEIKALKIHLFCS